MRKWTEKDQLAALRQGWGLFGAPFIGQTVTVIQRVDSPPDAGDRVIDKRSPNGVPRFPSDDAAAAYVVGRADAGDRFALRALRCVEHYQNTGRLTNWELTSFRSRRT